mmetsp:Transcript_21517/g.67130  ORF Transcript_21517/g.67130 Transcript_21517/m.67130 type:complete len:577 (+) Transcript_21517:82-1812(+)
MARVPMPKPALEELAFVDQQDTWPWQEGEQSTASSVNAPGASAASSPAGASSSVMVLAQQVSAWSEEADRQGPAGAARKELMRLRKKLREILSIEERLEAGMRIDPLQRPKIAMKQEVLAQIEQAERIVADDARTREEEQTTLQAEEDRAVQWSEEQRRKEAAMAEAKAAARQHEDWAEQQRAYEEQLAAWQMLPVTLAPVHMLVCEAPLPQQACAGQVPAATAPAGPSQAAQAEVPCAEYEAEQQEEAAKSQSARRRLRRQRAARRRPAVVPLTSGAEALQAEASEAGSGAASEGELEAKSCEELAKGLEAGGAARLAAVEALRGSVLRCALAATGCRVVQLALEVAERRAAEELVAELHGHVQEAIESPHANYVIQKVVEVMPAALSGFVAEELRGAGAAVARHRYGCRVLCRLLEHTGSSVSLMEVLDEVLAEARDLCRHAFGHYVLQSILEHGHASHRQRLASTLRSELLEHAQHRCSSHVLESALVHCSAEDREALAAGLLAGGADGVAALARGQFSSFVVRALIRQPGEVAQATWGHLQSTAAQVQKTRHGQRLLRDLGLKPAVVAAEFA